MNYSRANGDTYFQDESASGNPVASVDIDTELTALKTEVNKGFPKDCSENITGTFKQLKGADVASAGAMTLGSDGNYFDITGTTSITSIGSLGVGTVVTLHFDGALTFTHDGTNIICPGALNIQTYAGLEITIVEHASGDWRVIGTNDLSITVKSRGVTTVSFDTSTAKETLYTFTVPANLLLTNRGLRIRAFGTHQNNSGGAVNYTFEAEFGSTTISTSGAKSIATHADAKAWIYEIEIFNHNATNAQMIASQLGLFGTSSADGSGVIVETTPDGSIIGGIHNSCAEDSTGDLVFTLYCTMGTSHANTNVKLENIVIEYL